MHEELKALVRVIATTNGHPDPEGYADQVAANFVAQNAPVAPAATTETAPAA
jgi:hypothetical protein